LDFSKNKYYLDQYQSPDTPVKKKIGNKNGLIK